jgi:hypothetical protein
MPLLLPDLYECVSFLVVHKQMSTPNLALFEIIHDIRYFSAVLFLFGDITITL